MKSEKRQITEERELLNQEKKIKTPGEKENCKYVVILEANTIKEVEMKEKKIKCLRRMRKLLGTKLSSL